MDILESSRLWGDVVIGLAVLGFVALAMIRFRRFRKGKTAAKSRQSFLSQKIQEKRAQKERVDKASTLLNILSDGESGTTDKKTILPPPPVARARAAAAVQAPKMQAPIKREEVSKLQDEYSEFQNVPGTTHHLEKIVVQLFEEYIHNIAEYQQDLVKASSESEVIHKTCKALSKLNKNGRVVYLKYQPTQRALMVAARSSADIFAGTQPRMFLPLSVPMGSQRPKTEDVRECFESLSNDREIQRLLQDSCLLEAPVDGEISENLIWDSRTEWLVYPVYVRGVPQGVFAIQKHSVCERNEFENLVSIVMTSSSTAIENIRLHSRMTEVNSRDTITGSLTRKIFQERLEEAFLIARRLRHPLTVLRLEVAHIDAYQKRYGKAVGDAMLRHAAKHMNRSLRKSDMIARYDDKGFAIIFPHTAVVDALKKAESFIQELEASTLKIGSGANQLRIVVNAHMGLSEFPSHADNAADLLRFANEALHRGINKDHIAVSLAKVPGGYVPPFNSRFVRSAPKSLQEQASSPILDS